MVKINDPRGDTAAIAMRSLRATNTFKTIKKMVKNCKDFDEDKLDLDKNFHDNFVSCPESIKQELIFLWEEVGDLYEALQTKEKTKESYYIVQLDLDKKLPAPPSLSKRMYIMGP
jgi:hypothetical protein